MFEPPKTRYAKSGDVHVAYQIFGDGPPDVVLLSEWISHVEAFWDHPVFAQPLRRMAGYGRTILFDKRGVGLSDPVAMSELPSLEAWMDDLRAVMDAAGSERAALIGTGHGAQMAVMFAATHPDRTESLLLANGYARLARADDYPWGIPAHVQDKMVEIQRTMWGDPASPSVEVIAPSLAGDETVRAWWARVERLACSPGMAVTMQRAMFAYDVRHLLPAVTAPTLVLHTDNQLVRIGHGRYLAEQIPGAELKEFPGPDYWWWLGEAGDAVVKELVEFLGGTTAPADEGRVLATLLFTDVVGSTERASALGDAAWKETLDDLDALVSRQVTRFQGKLVKSLGDGHLATFDGPGRAISCATAISQGVRSLGLDVRCGVHTGEIDLRGDDVGGVALHIAARVMDLAGPNEVLVSGSVPPLVAGSGFDFEDRGEHELKGVPGPWSVFAVRR